MSRNDLQPILEVAKKFVAFLEAAYREQRKKVKLACLASDFCDLHHGHLGPCNDILEHIFAGLPQRNAEWKRHRKGKKP